MYPRCKYNHVSPFRALVPECILLNTQPYIYIHRVKLCKIYIYVYKATVDFAKSDGNQNNHISDTARCVHGYSNENDDMLSQITVFVYYAILIKPHAYHRLHFIRMHTI